MGIAHLISRHHHADRQMSFLPKDRQTHPALLRAIAEVEAKFRDLDNALFDYNHGLERDNVDLLKFRGDLDVFYAAFVEHVKMLHEVLGKR